MSTIPATRVYIGPQDEEERRWSHRATWITGGESIYALLGKFAALNALNNSELCALFLEPKGWGRGYARYPKVDLRSSAGIRKMRLSNLMGLDAAEMNLAFVEDLVPNSIFLSSNCLVWCARCAHSGYHSAAFQLNFYQTCPVHRIPLRRTCPKCKRALPYAVWGTKTSNFFSCDWCRHDLAQELRTFRPELMLNQHARAVMQDHIRLVQFTDRLPTLFNACKSAMGRPNMPLEFGRADLYRRTCEFQQFVADVLKCLTWDSASPELSRLLPTGVLAKSVEIQPLGKRGGVRKGAVESDPALVEASNLYRAVRRHVYRHYCRGHATCIAAAKKAFWWDTEGERTLNFCSTAHAYLRWRMQWEGCRIPGALDSTGRPRTHYGLLGWLSGDAPIGSSLWTPELEAWLRSHLLVCALFDSFAEWQRVAAQVKEVIAWQRSASQRFGKRHWACSGRGTTVDPANIFIEHAFLTCERAPVASGAHVRRTRKTLCAIKR